MAQIAAEPILLLHLTGEHQRTIRVEGPLTVEHIPSLHFWLMRVFGDAEEISLDLSGVDQMDSAGLSLLLEFISEARLGAVKFQITEASATVQSLIKMAGAETAIRRASVGEKTPA